MGIYVRQSDESVDSAITAHTWVEGREIAEELCKTGPFCVFVYNGDGTRCECWAEVDGNADCQLAGSMQWVLHQLSVPLKTAKK